MKIHPIFKTTLSSLTTLTSVLITASSALALSVTLSGTFEDGGTLNGTFDYDEITEEYSNINIETTAGNIVLTGNTYDSNLSTSGNTPLGVTISDDDTFYDLILNFDSALSSASLPISFTTDTSEFDDLSNERLLTNGTVSSTAVPFAFSPTLGLLLTGGVWGISYWKKKR